MIFLFSVFGFWGSALAVVFSFPVCFDLSGQFSHISGCKDIRAEAGLPRNKNSGVSVGKSLIFPIPLFLLAKFEAA